MLVSERVNLLLWLDCNFSLWGNITGHFTPWYRNGLLCRGNDCPTMLLL